jgi:GNAT superfamily N-acetyltransferase
MANEMDFLEQLGFLALGSRMRRLSDTLMSDVGGIYRELGIDFAPRWFPLTRLLMERAPTGISDSAAELGFTQPAISQLAREMVDAGLVRADGDPADERRRLLSLTDQGREMAGRLRPIWRWIEAAVTEAAYEAEADLAPSLTRFEAALMREGLRERTLRHAQAARRPVEVIDYAPAHREDWRRIGVEWVSREYVVEPADEKMFSDPEGEVLSGGGAIVFARVGEEIVGTCGLIPVGPDTYELIKMGVTPAARGLGVGRKLGERMLEIARQRGAKRVVLETNHRARAAIQLYRTLGFDHVPPFKASLGRTDTYMAVDLK